MTKNREIYKFVYFLLFFLIIILIKDINSCNDMICGSVVSKCMLTQSCKCDLKNCSCCKECLKCLNHLYTECCSCLDLCPKSNETNFKESHVEEFDGMPNLFNALVAAEDEKWDTVTFPIDLDKALGGDKFDDNIKYHLNSNTNEWNDLNEKGVHGGTVNCTVVYFKECLSLKKCKDTCESMGSSSYRWFHDACCECVGETCINFGINESRCQYCSNIDIDPEEDLDDLTDYGDGVGPLDSIENDKK